MRDARAGEERLALAAPRSQSLSCVMKGSSTLFGLMTAQFVKQPSSVEQADRDLRSAVVYPTIHAA